MKDLEKKISLSPTDFATLAICAIRYCHGRQTYMPSLVQGIVRKHLQELPDGEAEEEELFDLPQYPDNAMRKPRESE